MSNSAPEWGNVEVWSSLMMAGGFAVLYKLSCSCLCLNLQTEQGRATSCCSWDVRDVREDTVTLIAHVLLAKQRKSKPVAALFEACNSEQEVFLACSKWGSLRGHRVEYSIHTTSTPYAKCLPLRNVSEVLICKTKPAHLACQWGSCAP